MTPLPRLGAVRWPATPLPPIPGAFGMPPRPAMPGGGTGLGIPPPPNIAEGAGLLKTGTGAGAAAGFGVMNDGAGTAAGLGAMKDGAGAGATAGFGVINDGAGDDGPFLGMCDLTSMPPDGAPKAAGLAEEPPKPAVEACTG